RRRRWRRLRTAPPPSPQSPAAAAASGTGSSCARGPAGRTPLRRRATVQGRRYSVLGDFGFWIADFGLAGERQPVVQSKIQNSKSKIEESHVSHRETSPEGEHQER